MPLKKYIIPLLLTFSFLCGINCYADEKQNESLIKRNKQLETEISKLNDTIQLLKYPASDRAAHIKKLIGKNDFGEATKQINEFKSIFPLSVETYKIDKWEETVEKKRNREKEKQDKLKAKGVKVFTNKSTGYIKDLKYSFSPLYFGSAFYYDYCESIEASTYETLEKDRIFLLSTLTLSTDAKEAELPIIGVYVVEDGLLKRVNTFRYEYAWWLSYDAMINARYQTYHDFAYVSLIRYEIAAEMDAEMAKKPLVVLMNKTGRTIKWEMTPEEAEDECIIIKVMNRNKL